MLSEAKRQLVFTAQPIQDIAEELAFSDPSHFARFFRKHTGTTPHEFRDRAGDDLSVIPDAAQRQVRNLYPPSLGLWIPVSSFALGPGMTAPSRG